MTVPQPLGKAGDLARRAQDAGFSGLLFTETGRTAYLNAAVASQAAPGLELSTGVAVAFPRSPFVTAATAWELQESTGGKFRLGLGTQVRTHVVRRYGMEFERPGPRLRDYVRAVKACFGAFRSGTLKDTSLVAHELWRAQSRCFAAREYLRDRGTPRTPRDLLRHDCILFTPLAPRGRWTFRSRGRTVEVPVRGRLVVNSIPLALDAAMRGLGIVRVPAALVVEGLAAKPLVEVLDTYAPPPRPAYAVHPSGGRVAPAARVFLEIARRHLERKGF